MNPLHKTDTKRPAAIFRTVTLALMLLVLAACGSDEGTSLAEIATRAAATATASAVNVGDVETAIPAYCNDNPDRCIRVGDPNAPVKVVELSDYGCPHCKTFNENIAPVVKQLYVESGQAEYIVIPANILTQFQTFDSAVATLCAIEQDAGDAYHTLLFGYQDGGPQSRADHLEIAETLSLNEGDFRRCLNDGQKRVDVTANNEFGIQMGANSTPTVWVNGNKISPTLDAVGQAIELAASG